MTITREQIIAWAREAGFTVGDGSPSLPKHEAFAALIEQAVRQDEREQCAKVCEAQEYDYWRSTEDQDFTPQDCAAAIRARQGEKND